MTLEPGARVGPCRILERIGVGGMGEVYRAHDTTLDRDVAVKVLVQASGAGAERLARFEREARLLASLNHPNVGAIFGVEQVAGTRALILELVEGPTLADRIARGPMTAAEATPVARQIATALEAAHDRGIVHRDLKPSNVKIRPDGTVKVLDFGLAKVLATHPLDAGDLVTVTASGTREGVVVGTAAYMSPEQISGRPVDRRTDIWAFGCVLYEMLTGRRAFGGEGFNEILGRVLERDPDIDALPASSPAPLRRLVTRCLRKDPRERLRDIGDARLELEEVSSEASASVEARLSGRRRSISRGLLTATAALGIAALGVLAGWWLAGRANVSGDEPARVDLVFPPGQQVVTTAGSPAIISPDGRRIAYAARTIEGTYLYVRSLDDFEPTRLPGTEGANAPFFSPDSQSIGFCAGGRLLRVPVTGGAPEAIAVCRGVLLGASWGSDGSIVFSDSTVTGLRRVRAAGGAPTPLTEPHVPMTAGHRFPYQLPDGSGILFSTQRDDGRAELGLLRTGAETWEILTEGDARFTGMKYLSGGQLVFGQSGSIKVVGFDLATGRLSGEPRLVVSEVATSPASQYVYFSAADAGTLAYVPDDASESDSGLAWLDASGEVHEFARAPGGGLGRMTLSPDGSLLGVAIRAAGQLDPWVYDVATGRSIRLTRGAEASYPVWAPDQGRLAVGMGRSMGVVAANGTQSPQRVLERKRRVFPMSWSGGARAEDRIVFAERDAGGQSDIFVLSPASGGVTPLLTTAANEWDAMVSPGGRWLAYVSDETGRNEVYVQSFPEVSRKSRVSVDGGDTPRWSPSGSDLFYRRESTIFVVHVDDTGRPGAANKVVVAPPRISFEGGFDVAPGGRRFVVIDRNDQMAASRLRVVLHWTP